MAKKILVQDSVIDSIYTDVFKLSLTGDTYYQNLKRYLTVVEDHGDYIAYKINSNVLIEIQDEVFSFDTDNTTIMVENNVVTLVEIIFGREDENVITFKNGITKIDFYDFNLETGDSIILYTEEDSPDTSDDSNAWSEIPTLIDSSSTTDLSESHKLVQDYFK